MPDLFVDELDKSIAVLRKTSTIKALPPQYRDAEKWASIWVAYALQWVLRSSRGEMRNTDTSRCFLASSSSARQTDKSCSTY